MFKYNSLTIHYHGGDNNMVIKSEISSSIISENKTFMCFDPYEYYLLEDSQNFNDILLSINTIISINLGIKPTIIDINSYEPQINTTYNDNYEYENNGMIDSIMKYIKSNNKFSKIGTIIIVPIINCLNSWLCKKTIFSIESHRNMLYGNYYNQITIVNDDLPNTTFKFDSNFDIINGSKSLKVLNGFKYGYVCVRNNSSYPCIKLHYNSGHTYDIPEHQCYVVKNNYKTIYFFTCDPINIPFSEILKFDILQKPSNVYITNDYIDTNGKNIMSISNTVQYHNSFNHGIDNIEYLIKRYKNYDVDTCTYPNYKHMARNEPHFNDVGKINKCVYNTYIEGAQSVEVPYTFVNVPYTNMDVCEVLIDDMHEISLYL